MTEHDDRITERMVAEAKGYHHPPELSTTDLDAMWSGIETAAFPPAAGLSRSRPGAPRSFAARGWLPIAAALVLGIAIGRYARPRPPQPAEPQVALRADSLSMDEPYQSTTSRYLGQAVALLADLPAGARAPRADDPYMGRAHDLLLTTRLLLDSPAAADPRFRSLLEDLELVLAQVVRLQSAQSEEELDLIRQALEQRDVLPRLRSAVANISAD